MNKFDNVANQRLGEGSKKLIPELHELAHAFLKSQYVKKGWVDLNDKDSVWESLNEFADEFGLAYLSANAINLATKLVMQKANSVRNPIREGFQFNQVIEHLTESLSEQPIFVHERTGYNNVFRIKNAILVNDDVMELQLENGETIPMSIKGPNHNFKLMANDGTITDAMNVARIFGLLQPTCVVNEGDKNIFLRKEGTSAFHKDYNKIDHYMSLIMNQMFGKCLSCWSASHPAYAKWDKWVRKNYDKLRKMSDKEILRHFKKPAGE